MYERLNKSAKNAMAYRISQPLSRIEVREMVAEIEGEISASGKIRVLIDLQSFPYAELGAFWEDLKFDVSHAREIERFALVGGGEVEKWSARIFGALSWTKCRCFETGQVEEAWSWLTDQ